MEEEGTVDIVIVGAGISGLSTAVGLDRLGIRSMVLESSDKLRATGFAFTTWFNAWKAMEALGVSQHIRHLHDLLQGWVVGHISPGNPSKEMLFPKSEYVSFFLPSSSENIKSVVETTDLDSMVMSRLKYRPPWQLLWANIAKDNVCVAGDALHPMTPDIGQGGCSAMEDGVILARCLGEAMKGKGEREEEYKRIEQGLKKYAGERKWRSIDLITTAYTVGFIQQSTGKWMNLLRDKFLSSFLSRLLLKKAHFDCGSLLVP